jgi:hypothetical protein
MLEATVQQIRWISMIVASHQRREDRSSAFGALDPVRMNSQHSFVILPRNCYCMKDFITLTEMFSDFLVASLLNVRVQGKIEHYPGER